MTRFGTCPDHTMPNMGDGRGCYLCEQGRDAAAQLREWRCALYDVAAALGVDTKNHAAETLRDAIINATLRTSSEPGALYRGTGHLGDFACSGDVGRVTIGRDDGDWVDLTVNRADTLAMCAQWPHELEVIVRRVDPDR